jgi:SET family sugar efflux transporter-like MFS transporter
LTNIAILFFQDLLPRQLGLATSVFANAGNAGNLVGFFLFGGLLELFGHRGLLLGCALLCGIAFGLLTLVRSARPT